MNRIHKFIACFVRPHWIGYILIGMALTILILYAIRPSDDELRSLIKYIGYPAAATVLLAAEFMRIFYAELYEIYVPPRKFIGFIEMGSDSHFYNTIISGISFSRKSAGYIYALFKTIGFLGMGFVLMAGIYSIYTHQIIINH